MMPLWRRARSLMIDAAFPRTCAGCGMRGMWLCDRCARMVPRLDHDTCRRCGFPVQGTCRSCQHIDRAIARARAAFPYTGWVAQAVRAFKYADESDRAEHLAQQMVLPLADLGDVDVLVPVPLFPHKQETRGYNQSALLAQALSAMTGIPCRDGLVRVRNTPSQVSLNRDDRHANVEGAFTVDRSWAPPPGLRYVVIDDVRTTGSMISACARALSTVEPGSVSVLTLALDIPKRELGQWLAQERT
jgi:ComF family protein